MAILNRGGFPSSRNFAKPYRRQRMVKNADGSESVHWQDKMRLGAGGQEVDSTGCFGTRNTLAIRIQMHGPKKGRRKDKKAKNVCRLSSNSEINRLQQKEIDELIVLRGQLLTIRIVEETYGVSILDSKSNHDFHKLHQLLCHVLSRNNINQMYQQDINRANCVEGNLRNKPFMYPKHIKQILQRLSFVTKKIRSV